MFGDEGEDGLLDADEIIARLEEEFELPPLTEVAVGTARLGASRFFDCGDNAPDQVVTCLWLPSVVMVEVVAGWSRLPREQREGRHQTSRWIGRVPLFLIPGRLRGWEQLRESLAAAGSCIGRGDIGRTCCFHSLLADGATVSNLAWINPHPRRDRRQADCIAAYRWLARISRLCSLLPVQQAKEEPRTTRTAGRLGWARCAL